MKETETQYESVNDCIKYINQSDSKKELYIFKSLQDAKLSLEELKPSSKNREPQIVCIDTEIEENFIKAVYDLTKQYEQVVFICNDDNFASDEISNLSLKIDAHIYEIPHTDFRFYTLQENIFSKLTNYIKNYKGNILGKKIYISYSRKGGVRVDERSERIFTYKNMLIKMWEENQQKYSATCIKVLSNYTFKITRINVNVDAGSGQDTDLEMQLTNINGDNFTVDIPSKDKNNLASFRKIINRIGNFPDFFSSSDFSKIISQLYTESNIDTTYFYKRPGLIKGHKAWAYSDEIISLEN
jgi:hypothetical protein